MAFHAVQVAPARPVAPRAGLAPRLWAAALARIEASARVQWFAVFGGALAVYLLCLRTDPWAMSADPTGVAPSAWGLAHHGTPVVPASSWPFINPWGLPVGDGLVVSNRPPGLVFLAAPMYWLFRGADTWTVLPASIEAALVTAAAVATFGLLIRRLAGARIGLAAALIGGFGTTTWAVSGVQLFPHGPDQLLLVLAMLALAGARPVRGSLGAGLAFGLAVIVRPPLALVAAVLGLVRSWTTRTIRPALIVGAGTAAGLGAFLLYSHRYWSVRVGPAGQSVSRGVLNGTATHGYRHTLLDWSPDIVGHYLLGLVGALVSPGRGILVGAPFLLLLIPGLRAAWRSAPTWARALAAGSIAYLLVQFKAEPFTGGQFFWSYRYPLETLTLCAPLLVLSWQAWTARTPLRRAWFAALVTVAIGLQAVGALCFHGPYPDRPWTFDNLGAALSGTMAPAGYALLAAAALIAARILHRAYAGRSRT